MKNREFLRLICKEISARNGLQIACTEEEERESTFTFRLRPHGIESNAGFSILTRVFWHIMEIRFEPENYAGNLLKSMGCKVEKLGAFLYFEEKLRKKGNIYLFFNDKEMDLGKPEMLEPDNFQKIRISYSETFPNHNLEKLNESLQLIIDRTDLFFSLILCLLPHQDFNDEESEEVSTQGLQGFEGGMLRKECTLYERSRLNRKACISAKGTRCEICGFDFGEFYGEVGKDYIEVHHIIPLSKMGGAFIIDPVKDLIPICSNCHAIIHRRTPTFSPEELKEILKEKKGTSFL